MIPCSVELTDFLSHRCDNGAPVIFDFDGAKLWSVAGDNGAGKSAIFDAITWTLYGQHRGGSQDAKRLICHGAEGCQAAFVFAVGGTRYRAQRSARHRSSARRSAARWNTSAAAWEEIPGTTSVDGFNDWRDRLLGLTYDAFTQSMLLIQGGSDRLIASGAKERFEILAQLVDLSAYQELEERAKNRASEARGKRQALDAELERVPAVQDDERAAATAELKRLTEERETRAAAWRQQVSVVEGARHYTGLLARRQAVEDQLAETDELLGDGERIHREDAELNDLATAKPHLAAALRALRAASDARGAAGIAAGKLESIDVPALDTASTEAEEAAEKARNAATVAAERASALRNALPTVETAIARRLELLAAEGAAAAAGDPTAVGQQLAAAQRALEDATTKSQAARNAERVGERAVSEVTAALRSAETALERVQAGHEEAVCTRCGQPVPPGHRLEHIAHLHHEVDEQRGAEARASAAMGPLVEAREEAERSVEAARGLVTKLTTAQARAVDAQRLAGEARTSAEAAHRAAEVWDDPRAGLLAGGDRTSLEGLREALRMEAQQAADEERRAAGAARTAENDAAAAAAVAQDGRTTRAELVAAEAQASQVAASEERRAEIELDRVPASWARRTRDGEEGLLEALTDRVDELADVREQAEALASAEETAAAARAALSEVEGQLRELPDAHRVDPDGAQVVLEEREREVSGVTALVDDARAQLRDLEERGRRRQEHLEDLEQAIRDERVATRLVTLLGRQGIQGQLIVRAARGLERLANETLQAISGGTLTLEIRPEDRRGRDEIVISARDYNAGGHSTDASFLSGSEKFRVCVAMAAAIGKYASGRASIESLIIDEGFGSLDEAGRDEMIDELQRLSQLLERVIVVSHQEEFQDRARFPHGYRLRRNGSSTEVERFV